MIFLQMTEKLLDLENENVMRVAELEKTLLQREKELEMIRVSYKESMRVSYYTDVCIECVCVTINLDFLKPNFSRNSTRVVGR